MIIFSVIVITTLVVVSVLEIYHLSQNNRKQKYIEIYKQVVDGLGKKYKSTTSKIKFLKWVAGSFGVTIVISKSNINENKRLLYNLNHLKHGKVIGTDGEIKKYSKKDLENYRRERK